MSAAQFTAIVVVPVPPFVPKNVMTTGPGYGNRGAVVGIARNSPHCRSFHSPPARADIALL
jgi:hypothetical protein